MSLNRARGAYGRTACSSSSSRPLPCRDEAADARRTSADYRVVVYVYDYGGEVRSDACAVVDRDKMRWRAGCLGGFSLFNFALDVLLRAA